MKTRKLATGSAIIAAVTAFTLVNAPTAQAERYRCHKDGIYTRCLNGFKAGDWKAGTSLMVLNNGYSYDKTARVYNSSGGPFMVCIRGGGKLTFDRDTYQGIVIPGSTGC
jgi:hypothetical protein